MFDILSRFSPGELIGLVAVVGAFLCGIICGTAAIIGDYWLRMRHLALKQTMVERGMSAEEIQAVFEAGSKRASSSISVAHS
jgi:hypothetical protein